MTGRVQRLLPDAWQGDGREARWRRSRGRKVLAALLAAAAVPAVAAAVRPADPATRAVTVARHDLAAGRRLAPGDLREVRWAAQDRLPGLLTSASAAGKVLTAPITAGEPITSARVRRARSWPAAPHGTVIIGVTSADRALVRALQPGDRVDLIDTARARTLAASVPVLAVPAEPDTTAHPTLAAASDEPAVLVAVTPKQAAAVGSAATARSGGIGGGIQLALRPGS